MPVIFVFIFGLFIGSFLNVVIFRLRRQEKFIKGRSKCLFCGHQLYAKDLVPLLSFLWLKGRCRYCQQRFSRQYFWVELATGILFALVWQAIMPESISNYWRDWLQLIAWLSLTSFLLIIFVYDLKYYLILDKLIYWALGIALVTNIILGQNIIWLIVGVAVGASFFGLQYIVSKGKWIGGGDIYLGGLLGAILAWPNILLCLFLAYLLGSVVSIGLLLNKRKQWQDKIPFGTFLSLAGWLCLLYGEQIIAWYRLIFLL